MTNELYWSLASGGVMLLVTAYLARGAAMQPELRLALMNTPGRMAIFSLTRILTQFIAAIGLWIAFGCLAGTIQGPSYAARVCSGAEALFESLNTALPAAYRPLYEAYLGGIKSQVASSTWDSWWAEGKALSQEEISMLVLDTPSL